MHKLLAENVFNIQNSIELKKSKCTVCAELIHLIQNLAETAFPISYLMVFVFLFLRQSVAML